MINRKLTIQMIIKKNKIYMLFQLLSNLKNLFKTEIIRKQIYILFQFLSNIMITHLLLKKTHFLKLLIFFKKSDLKNLFEVLINIQKIKSPNAYKKKPMHIVLK